MLALVISLYLIMIFHSTIAMCRETWVAALCNLCFIYNITSFAGVTSFAEVTFLFTDSQAIAAIYCQKVQISFQSVI